MKFKLIAITFPILLAGCSHQNVKNKPVNQQAVLQNVNKTAKLSMKNNHPIAWAQLQKGQALLKANKQSEAAKSFEQAQIAYRNVYGKYSVRMAEFDTTVGDSAYRAKAWSLANLYYLRALRAHQAMAVVLPAKVQQDVDKLHAVFVKTHEPRSLDYGYHSALENLQTINRQSSQQIARLQDSYLSLLSAQEKVVKNAT